MKEHQALPELFQRLRVWLHTLQAQLLLWSVLPLTLLLIAMAFVGIRSHEQAMLDFAASRDLRQAELEAVLIRDGLLHGTILPDGTGLEYPLHIAAPGSAARLYVVDASGRVLSSLGTPEAGQDLHQHPGVQWALQNASGSAVTELAEGERVLLSAARIEGVAWWVILEEPTDAVLGDILRFSGLVLLLALGAGIISLLTVYFGLRTVVTPLRRLSDAAAHVGWGDFRAIDQSVGGVAEIAQLQQTLREMTERIRGYQRGMEDYVAAITQGQEAERARLAHELHDTTIQELVALDHRLQMASRELQRGNLARAQSLLQDLRQMGMETIANLRRLIQDLRPPYLEDLGLVPSLEALLRNLQQPHGPQMRLEVHGDPVRLASEVELAVYRIAQEALQNALHHAEAQHVTVTLTFGGDEVSLAVSDDGRGFTVPGQPDVFTEEGHFGILGMRERALLLGGHLSVHSAPGQGTTVAARLPLR